MGKATDEFIHFLGTGGARFVMIRQQRSTAGVLYSLRGVRLLVDPGPGCLVRCVCAEPRIDPTTLDAILLTHGHLDHSGDVNVMIEAMTEGGHSRKGLLLAPRDALEGDPCVLRYVRRYLARIEELAEGKSFELADGLTLTTPVRHDHGGETYGFCLDTPDVRIGHVVDSRWFPELGSHYGNCDVLIVHVVFDRLTAERKRRMPHMDADDAARLIREAEPRLAVITHFGTPMLRAGPAAVAARMADEAGIEVIAAEDGMRLDLATFSTRGPESQTTPETGGRQDG